MPYKSTDHLYKLINSLTTAEKRQFKISMKGSSTSSDSLFMALFDHIDKNPTYDEAKILKQVKGVTKRQLSNLKSNLYKKLLTSLRQQHRTQSIDLQLREQLDHAQILYNKGLYRASIDQLEKIKKQAQELEKRAIHITALELEKKIEALYITGSMYPKAVELKTESNTALDHLNVNHKLSNLSLSLYGMYLQKGFVKDNEDYDELSDFFKINLPSVSIAKLDFYGKLFYFQSHVWYHFMIQDFPNYFKYATKWKQLFEEENDQHWIAQELTIYIKSYHNVLNALFMSQAYDRFIKELSRFKAIGEKHIPVMNRDEYSTYILIKLTHEVNEFFLNGKYGEAVKFIATNRRFLIDNDLGWDLNRELSSNFKIGCLYFCEGDFDESLLCLNRITNYVYPNFREDIQCFARMLSLIIHFEKENEQLISHQIISTYRYLSKIEHLQKGLKYVLEFLRKLPKTSKSDLKGEFIKLKINLERVEGEDFEKRPFLYLDIISWLESKIEGVPLKEVLRRKIALLNA